MKKVIAAICCSLLFMACGGSKMGYLPEEPSFKGVNEIEGNGAVGWNEKEWNEKTPSIRVSSSKEMSKTAKKVVKNALKYRGTPYAWGGESKNGMDCSGLIYVAYGKENIDLPRTSRSMSYEGEQIDLNEVQSGDLLFFQTGGSNVINHVGMVVKVTSGTIKFVHSTTSLGVTVSKLSQPYWNSAFVMTRRLL